MKVSRLVFLSAGIAAASPGCAMLPLELPREAAPLFDMEEPLTLVDEPEDEQSRRSLAVGGFTGIYVGDARRSLDDLTGESEGLLVTRVVENSPADGAGIAEGDLLLWVTPAGENRPQFLKWTSQWREVELASEPGTTLLLRYDRAGVERDARLTVERRLSPPDRHAVERLREEDRVGVIVRTATEVEARAAGLGPGAGAVIVGLSRGSPWRAAGLQFSDLIVAVDDATVAHPQVLLDAIRGGHDTLRLTYVRDGDRQTVVAPITRREREVKEISIPLLYHYQRERGVTETSILLGLFAVTETPAAWRLRLLWIFTFAGGDADRLKEVDS